MRSVPYLAAVGALMYLATTTQPDIAYTVGCLSRFNSNPSIAHWQVVKQVLHYLKGTAKYGITRDVVHKELIAPIQSGGSVNCGDFRHYLIFYPFGLLCHVCLQTVFNVELHS